MTSADHSAVVNCFSRESWLQDQYIILGNVWFGTWKGKEKKKDLRGEKKPTLDKSKGIKVLLFCVECVLRKAYQRMFWLFFFSWGIFVSLRNVAQTFLDGISSITFSRLETYL